MATVPKPTVASLATDVETLKKKVRDLERRMPKKPPAPAPMPTPVPIPPPPTPIPVPAPTPIPPPPTPIPSPPPPPPPPANLPRGTIAIPRITTPGGSMMVGVEMTRVIGTYQPGWTPIAGQWHVGTKLIGEQAKCSSAAVPEGGSVVYTETIKHADGSSVKVASTAYGPFKAIPVISGTATFAITATTVPK